jgi:lysophospholipase L1-like esterase
MPGLSTRKKILTVLLAPVIFLGLLEVGLRLAGYSYDPVAEGSRPTPHDEWQDIERFSQDPDLLWTLKPSTRLDDRGMGFVEVRTNAAGLRGPELPSSRQPNEIRILCLGDSITFGLGLTEQQAFTSHLERRLSEGPLGRGRRIRVISAAVPGWSSIQGLRALDRFQDLEPNVVVFWFGMNDSQPARVLPDSRLSAPDAKVVRTTNVLRSLRSFQLIQGLLHTVMGGIDEPCRVSTEEFAEVVLELRRRSEAGGPRLIFVRCPNTIDLAAEQATRVIARAEEIGVKRVYGPFPLLTPLRADHPGTDLVGRREVIDGEPTLVLSPERVEVLIEVRTMKGDLAALDKIRKALKANLATLPPDSIDEVELFGGPARIDYFIDCCHLSPLGAQKAGESLARIIEERIK